jgi:signal transduction histidine kinase
VAESALTRQVTGEYDEEYRIVRRDGVIRWVRDRAFPIRNETGTVYRIAGVAADITERKEAQEALRHAYDTIEAIMSSLPCSILILDGLQRVTFANSSACERFSAGTFPLLGRRLADVLPLRPPDWARLQEGLGTQAGCRREQEFELAGRVYRACQFPVSIREHPQTGLLLWDITEQKELQSQLIQAEKLASLGTMVSGMAHEINNPMHGILGMAELILDEDDPELMKEYARDIVAYSHHVATVVRDFACYARSADKDEIIDVDLNERLTEAVKMLRRSPQFGNIEVVTSFTPDSRLRAKRSELDQVFVNLISNAAQAMDGKGRLTLATRREPGSRLVTVGDTGCGIPKALLPKIFEPFFTTKTAGKGTGLGLSIVHKIVTKYGGAISVESDHGKGTTFTVRFPDPQP